MVQVGINLVFIVEGAGVAAIDESNALLSPPTPPTIPANSLSVGFAIVPWMCPASLALSTLG